MMEARLIVAYVLIALLALIALASCVVVARVRRDQRRLGR